MKKTFTFILAILFFTISMSSNSFAKSWKDSSRNRTTTIVTSKTCMVYDTKKKKCKTWVVKRLPKKISYPTK